MTAFAIAAALAAFGFAGTAIALAIKLGNARATLERERGDAKFDIAERDRDIETATEELARHDDREAKLNETIADLEARIRQAREELAKLATPDSARDLFDRLLSGAPGADDNQGP